MESVTNTLARSLASSTEKDQDTLATLFKTEAGKSTKPAAGLSEKLFVAPLPQQPQSAPPASGSALDEAEQLSAHWDDWGMHEGVSFSDPPSSLPQDAQDTIKYFGDHPVLYQSIIQDAGNKPGDNTMYKSALDQFIKDAKGDAQAADDALPSGTSNSTLQSVRDIVANWHAWGLASGVTPFSNPPPDNLPPEAKTALGAITSDPYLLSQIGNHTGSGAITRDDVVNFLKQASDNPVLLDQPAQDTHVHDYLDALGSAVSDDDKKQLAQIGDDAQTLQNFFEAYPNGAPELNTEIPPNVAAAEKRLLGVDAIKKQLEGSDGKVTRYTVGDFVKSLDKAADSAKDSWQSFKKDNGSADPVATREAADASILQANLPVLDAAGKNAKVDGAIDAQDLQAVGHSDSDSQFLAFSQKIRVPSGSTPGKPAGITLQTPGAGGNGDDASLPSALKNAAAFYSDPGEFNQIASATKNATDKPNTTPNNDNFDTFLANGTPKTADDSLASLKSAAIQNAVQAAGGNPNKLTPKDFNDDGSLKPSTNASGADKAATLVQLSQTLGRAKAGDKYLAAENQAIADLNKHFPGNALFDRVQKAIDTLSQDPDVQSFLQDKLPGAMQDLVKTDPGIKDAVQKGLDDATTPQALQDAFAQKDDKGNPLSTTAALNAFVSRAGGYAQALGTSPDDLKTSLRKALAGAPQDIKDKVSKGYDDIVSGKEVGDLKAQGKTLDQAITQATADKSAYDAVLDDKTVQDGSDKFEDNVTAGARGDLANGKKGEDLLKGLGITGPDDPALLKFVQDNINTLAPGLDPSAAPQIVALIRGGVDAMRGTAKFDDAMKKASSDWSSKVPGASPAYKAGVFHGASALLLAGAMGARIGTQGSGSVAQNVQQSLQLAGLITEGGAKYYLSTHDALEKDIKDLKSQLKTIAEVDPLHGQVEAELEAKQKQFEPIKNLSKDVENAGKGVLSIPGAAAGVVLGALSAKQAFASGDTVGGALDVTTTGLSGISTISGIGEVVTYVLPRLGLTAATAGLETAAGVFGAIGGAAGVLGAVAGIGLSIYALVEQAKADAKFDNDFDSWWDQQKEGLAPLVDMPSSDDLHKIGESLPPPTIGGY